MDTVSESLIFNEDTPLSFQTDSPFFTGYNPFALKVEGVVTANGGLDTEGIPADINDDARLYAGLGFDFNGENLILPVLREDLGSTLGNPILNAAGQFTLLDEAVVVGANPILTEATSDAYANLIPPTSVSGITVAVPSFAEVEADALARRVEPGITEVNFDPSRVKLNNARQWANNFPMGTATEPLLVRIPEGDLTIPSRAKLSNTIVIVEQGDLTFRGNGQELTDVVLLSEQGDVALGQVDGTDVYALAGETLTTKGGARFRGDTLLASGSLTFNGATAGNGFVTLFAEGPLTYNGASGTQGQLFSQGDVTFNGRSSLQGTIRTTGDLTFNGPTAISDINRPPLIVSAPTLAVDENVETAIYTGEALDPNQGDILTWSLEGADASQFTLDAATGELTFQTAPNFEAPADSDGDNDYEVLLTVSDPAGLSTTLPLTVTVNDVNEPPVVTAAEAATVDENTLEVAYTATATDPDAGDTLTWTLSRTDAALLSVNESTGAVTFKAAPNFEVPQDANQDNVYEFTVTATDGGA
jgi:hypothetical protein